MKRRLLTTTPAIVVSDSNEVKKEDVPDGPKINRSGLFKHMTFVLFGYAPHFRPAMRDAILELGGTCKSKVDENTTALISSPYAVKCNGTNVQNAKSLNVHVVSEDLIEEAKNFIGDPITLIEKHSIVSWGGDISSRISKSVASVSCVS